MKKIFIISSIIILTLLANILYSFVYFNLAIYNKIDIEDSRIYAKDNSIEGIDEFLHNTFDDYKGYYHYDNISEGRANLKINTRNYKILHLNKNIDIMDISTSFEGELIDYSLIDYDILPVYIYGTNTSNIKIGKEFDLSLYSKNNDKIINKKCKVIGIIKGLNIPQHSPLSIEDRYQVHKNLIVIPDIFRDEIFVEDNKYVLNLDYDKAKAIDSNVFVLIDDEYLPEFDIDNLLSLFLINFLIYNYILVVLYYKLISSSHSNKSILNSFIIIISLILITSLIMYLISDYFILVIFNLSTFIFITINVFICLVIYYFYRRNINRQQYIEVKKSYERI